MAVPLGPAALRAKQHVIPIMRPLAPPDKEPAAFAARLGWQVSFAAHLGHLISPDSARQRSRSADRRLQKSAEYAVGSRRVCHPYES